MKDSLSCCVCLKEEPFENNPIVSCDGKNCSTTVHKTCYGIQQIPDGAWFCQKCISQERTARVRCELCPNRDGALKHTNKGGWCHIICALFVPGAEFLDTERLESISVDKVLSDKLNKMCTICEKNNRLDRATAGACIQCIKSGCKVLFHVTCAQSQGLLTEIVNSKDGVRYVAYCFAHKHKTKHKDFSIRLSSSSHSLTRCDKNKLRQTPPQLEKSDEDCVTPQDIFLDTDNSISSKNMNISSSSGNANFSSDSTSFDDSNDRIAPMICSSSEISEFQGKKKNICSQHQYKKSIDGLKPPNITTAEPHSSTDIISLPPNLCCSDASESVAKEEATVKSSTGSVTSDVSSNRPVKRQATTSSSDIQPKKQKIIKPEAKLPIKTEMVLKQEKIKKARKVSQPPKSNKGGHFNKLDSDKIQALAEIETHKDKKSVPPYKPKSMFSHMSSLMGGTGTGSVPSTSFSATSTSSTKITGTTCQSMEELLEWQWDQTGTLLMQQAEASDIASLLSCLHDLKNENEQLLSKQLKLSHRRDHLKAVNAKLQMQLNAKTNPNPSMPSIIAPVASISSERVINRPPTMTTPQTTAKSLPKSHKSTDLQMSHHKPTAIIPNIPNGDIRTRQVTDSKTTFIQPQQQSIMTNQVWGNASKSNEAQINPQTVAFLKHYQQQQQHGLVPTVINQPVVSTPPVPNVISQTDLVTFLNNQLHSQLSNNNQATTILTATQKPISQDIHNIASNNSNNMELIYQAIQQKKHQQQQQQQQQHQLQQQQQIQLQQHNLPSHYYYHNTNKMPPTASAINSIDNSVAQTPDRPSVRNHSVHQRTRPSESLCQQIRSAKSNTD